MYRFPHILKKDDGTLEFTDSGKANLMNSYFATVVSNTLPPPTSCRYGKTCSVFTSWKTARLNPVYKKDDETDCCNYRPVSLLSVPSKILKSVVNDTIVRHVYKVNNLVTDKQWAYRAGLSTELLLIHLTETWRKAVDAGLVVAVALIDFKKAFDSVSHTILEMVGKGLWHIGTTPVLA